MITPNSTASPAPTRLTDPTEEREPTAAELAAIEYERPLIEAELAVVNAEIEIIRAGNGAGELAWRRLRRAQHRVLRAAAALAPTGTPASGERAA
jgi:hypothetical protein